MSYNPQLPYNKQQEKKDSVLFFGRKDCKHTEDILNYIKKLRFDVTHILSQGRGETLPQSAYDWQGDYILCFRSLFVLPKEILTKANIAAINLHPGPPEYPGSGCINFALYDNASRYGVTAHIMNEKIDNGQILAYEYFPITQDDNVSSLVEKAHIETVKLFTQIVDNIKNDGINYIEHCKKSCCDITWRKNAAKIESLDKLQIIPADIDKAELERIIRATYISGFPPKIYIHGYEFILKL